MSIQDVEELYEKMNINSQQEESEQVYFPPLQYENPSTLKTVDLMVTNSSSFFKA